jgi:hypothetical protein
MPLTSTTQANRTILNESQTAVAAVAAVTNTTKGENPRIFDGGNPIDTKLEANTTTTTGMGSVDDLLGISFTGFNQTPSNDVPPSPLFTFSFSAPWSQNF